MITFISISEKKISEGMQRGVAVSVSGSGKSKWLQTESETNGVLTY